MQTSRRKFFCPNLVMGSVLGGDGGAIKTWRANGVCCPCGNRSCAIRSPLFDYLVSKFLTVPVVAIRKKLFPDLSEDCWLLYADGFGGVCTAIRFSVLEQFDYASTPPVQFVQIDVNEWRMKWKRRLRPFL